MRVLYFDCIMGAAGDMICASLYELLSDEQKKEFLEKINSAGVEGVRVLAENSEKCRIAGTHMKVLIDGREEGIPDHKEKHHEGHHHEEHHHDEHHHHHSGLKDIEELIDSMKLPGEAAKNAKAIYAVIAEAESHVHRTPVDEIHFHEVGTKDAVIDVVSACLLMEMIKPGKICASTVSVGSGTVCCMHGTLPVPAPATARILEGVPICAGSVKGELTTPTGAAILKYFVTSFTDMPKMRLIKTGYGMGTKDFEIANCLRAFLGEEEGDLTEAEPDETVTVLMCNVDDMTGEETGFACERFFEAGASEVFTVPVYMKKSRPGIMIEVICKNSLAKEMIGLMFRHTTTIGIRRFEYKRYILDRKLQSLKTDAGDVICKESEGYGTKRKKYEYGDLSKIARKNNMSLFEAREYVRGSEEK